ncbi:MBG domain-containing protein [Sphingobacterium spiritivorum]|uniref:MBG domain-containing protein n=1 Tax=Sphingobacterium spiritivorum TaxID=258 RepID=UPI003DA5CF31
MNIFNIKKTFPLLILLISINSLGATHTLISRNEQVTHKRIESTTLTANKESSDHSAPSKVTTHPLAKLSAGNHNSIAGKNNIHPQAAAVSAGISTANSYTADANGILYVKKGVTGTGDSWNNAIGELADALRFVKINNAVATNLQVKQIWVAGGTYSPMYSPADNNFGNPDARNNSFLLINGVKLYGGFAGTETSSDQRDLTVSANKSILSGDLNYNGTVDNNDAYHVLISVNNTSTDEINGFTITGGNANNSNGSVTVNGLSIDQDSGGGIYNRSSFIKINNCTFTGNVASDYGGAIYNYYSSPNVTKSTFSVNTVNTSGAAIYNYYSHPDITDCVFAGNTASNTGGALFNQFSNPKIANSIFRANTANRAGAIFDNESFPKIYNSLFVKNNALTAGGGAIYHHTNGSINVFMLTNCILYGNTGGTSGWAGGIHSGGSFNIYNSVIWGNEGGQTSGYTQMKNSLVQGLNSTADGNLDATNINVAQLFQNPNGGDGILGTADDNFLLIAGSPLVEKGDNNLYTNTGGNLSTDKDLAGNARFQGTKIDIGAFEMTLMPQTITAADMTKTYGDIAFIPTATASSGLEVTYASADNSIAEAFQDSGNGNKWKLKIKKAGVVKITAKQAGNATYNPAPEVIFKLTINKAPLAITADAKSKETGTADPALTFTATGLVNGDTQTVISGTLQRTMGEAAGTYPITQGTITAANYTINYTGADFTITNAPGHFITVWDMTKISTHTKINLNITTLTSPNNQVRYFWTAPDGSSGSGIVSTSGNHQITIPANKPTITLHIKPENLASVVIFNEPRIIDVAQWGTVEWRSMQTAFVQCSNLNVTATDMPDLSRVTTMRSMFADCSSLTGPANIGSWNTSNVTNMIQVFSRATRFNQDISNWDTRNVTTMAYMFRGASAFNQNISGWNTEKVNDMEAMFQFAQAFNQNISNWNTASVTNMSKMFNMATSFNQEIGSWNTSKVTNMEGMFQYAYAFNGNIGNWNTENVTNLGSMFSYALVFNQNIGNWNTAKVTSMWGMFWNAGAFNQNIGNWNTANVTHMGYMFRENPIFNQDISNWNTANVTNMEEMFRSNPVFNHNIGNWNTANVTTMENMFQGAQSFNQDLGDWQLNPVVKMTNMLSQSGLDCTNYSATLRGWAANPNTPSGRNLGALYRQYGTSALAARTSLTTTKGWTITGDSPSGTICGRPFITVWDMNISDLSQHTPTTLRFGITTLPNKPVSYTWTSSGGSSGSGTLTTNNSALIAGLPAGEIITLSIASEIKAINIMGNINNDKRRLINITQWGDAVWSTMENAFHDCVNLNVTATDIPNLSAVRSMRDMFNNCQSMTGPANIGSWNTTTVNNMEALFTAARSFNQDIGNWNTANVTNMGYMFSGARAFNQDLSNWNTTNVTNMEGMFQETRASNLNISNWNTQNVTNMQGMFAYSPVFNEDISNWNTSNVTNMSNMFGNSEAFNQNISSWNTAAVTNMSGMFARATSFNQPIGNWNTAAVTNMYIMFASAKNFNQDIGNWNTSAVTNMSGMFDSATAFNKPIGNWNTAAVTNMHGMFNRTSSFNQDISRWNISSVTRIGYMFVEATAFNQNIGNWQLNPNADMTNMLDFSGMDCTNYSLTLQGWANNPNTPSGRNLGAVGRQYGTNAVAARKELTTAKGWTITGDSPSGQSCGLSQTITATDMVKTYGDAPFVPTATASSGLEVSYVSSNNSIAEAFQDSADGNKWKLKINKAGQVNITAQQAGNANYNPAADIIFKLTITKATLNIVAEAKTKVYGSADPALTYTVTGFENGDDQSIITGALTRTAGEAIGTYNIEQGTLTTTANYDIFYTGADFTITKATLNIVAEAKSKVYGSADPALTYTVTGFENGDDQSVITGALTRVSGEAVGTYNIEQGTLATSANYDITYTGADFNITKAPLNIVADAKSKVYGSVDPALTYTVTGFENGDDQSIITGALSRTAGESVGTYNIEQGTLATTANYDITYTGADFDITKATLIIRADAKSKVYGSADPVLTYTVTGLVNGDNQSIITGTLTRAAGENISTYAIEQGTLATTANYDITYTAADFTITKATLNIVADAKSKVYGTADPALTYTVTGLTNGDDQSIITGALTRAAGENIGTYAIQQGTLAVSGNYDIVYSGTDFNITKATLNIVADAQFKVYGTADPALTYTVTGFENGDDQSIITGALTRLAGENIGTYAIEQGTLATTANYDIVYTEADFNITKATLNIVADAKSKVYGSVDPALTYTVTGFENGDDQSIITGALTRVAGEAVGTYNIEQGTLSTTANYDITYTGADFDITKATLNIVAEVKTKVYGTADPALTYTVTGLANGDNQSIITGVLTRTTGEAVGIYNIEQGTLATTANYNIVYTGADFNITKSTLNIVADAQSKVYGSADPALTYTVTGFESGDDQSIITGALTRVAGENTGTYAIQQGTLAVSGNYDITFTGTDFTITKATLNIVTEAKSKVYGSVDPALTYTVTGFENGDDQSIITGTLTRVAGENIGTYAIEQGTLATSSNYDIIYTGADFDITKATLNIVAEAKSKVYGSADPALTYSVTGLINGDDQSIITGALIRTAGESVGTYNIEQGTLAVSGNYDIVYSGADFNITKATLNIVADAQSKVYGSVDPALTYTVTGLVNGDNQSIITGTLTRVAGENIGTYAIEQGTLATSANYDITYTGADFTITKATLNIVADAKSKVYGTADPALTYTVTGFENGDDQSIITGALSRTAGEEAGIYRIEQGTLTAGANYNITYTGADFTITGGTLFISAETKSKVYGSADPELTYTVTGFTNGDDQSIITGTLTRVKG